MTRFVEEGAIMNHNDARDVIGSKTDRLSRKMVDRFVASVQNRKNAEPVHKPEVRSLPDRNKGVVMPVRKVVDDEAR